MKIVIEIEADLDGEATDKQIEAAALSAVETSVVTSEDMNDGSDYAVIFNSITASVIR